jgi:hypothetical protein
VPLSVLTPILGMKLAVLTLTCNHVGRDFHLRSRRAHLARLDGLRSYGHSAVRVWTRRRNSIVGPIVHKVEAANRRAVALNAVSKKLAAVDAVDVFASKPDNFADVPKIVDRAKPDYCAFGCE